MFRLPLVRLSRPSSLRLCDGKHIRRNDVELPDEKHKRQERWKHTIGSRALFRSTAASENRRTSTLAALFGQQWIDGERGGQVRRCWPRRPTSGCIWLSGLAEQQLNRCRFVLPIIDSAPICYRPSSVFRTHMNTQIAVICQRKNK